MILLFMFALGVAIGAFPYFILPVIEELPRAWAQIKYEREGHVPHECSLLRGWAWHLFVRRWRFPRLGSSKARLTGDDA